MTSSGQWNYCAKIPECKILVKAARLLCENYTHLGPIYSEHQRHSCDVANNIAPITVIAYRFLNTSNESLHKGVNGTPN